MRQKKFVPLALSIFLIVVCIQVKGQVSTNTSILRKASLDAALKEKDLARKLLTLSQQKGWPLTIANKKGSRAVLVGIDPKGYPLYVRVNDNIISAATIKTNLLWPGGSTGLNLDGSTIAKGKLAIWDEGKPRPTHIELVNRIVQKDNTVTLADHSTHVAGTMIATGVNPAAKGMAFGALQLSAYDFNNHLSEMLGESPNLLVSNHSYGSIAGWNFNSDQNRWEFWGNFGDTVDYKFGYYSSDAQVWDSIAYNAPFYLIVKSVGNNREETGPAVGQPYYRFNASHVMASAGNRPNGISNNDGYDIIPTYGVAKNILSVGAVYPIPSGYTQPSDVVLAEFSSWGPTDDGRIKPDVVTDGVDVLSSVATSDNAYASFSGTSMSTPAASGSSYLLQEYYAKLHAGAFMRSATLKGIIIHTADEAGPSAGPDYQYGWGLINMEKAASVITSNNTDQLIYENNLLNGNSFTLPVVASGKGPLIATISWTDPKGPVDDVNILNNPAKKLVNDLDIRITSGATTFTPWVLDRTHPGNAATNGDDTLNNVEKIVINNAIPGQTYTIKVTHKGTLDRGQQAYSLLVSGVGGQAYCASGATSSAGTRIDSVIMSNVQNGNPPGCTTYTNYANVTAQIQSDQTLPFTIKLSGCDGTTNSRIVKIFIDYNNNGLFTDPGEQVAQSAVLSGGAATFTGNIVTPAGLKTGNFTLMRVVAMETTNPASVTPCGTYGNGETQDYRVQIIAASNDVGVSQLVDPLGAICANDSQRVSIRIKNFGTSNQLNVPITTTVQNGATTILTINTICPDTIPALGEIIYTFQAPFQAVVGNSYTITSKTNLVGDQDPTNDQNVTTITVGSGVNNAKGLAEICSDNPVSVALAADLADTNDLPVWYDSPTSTTPIAAGAKTSTTVLPSNKVYYLSLNEINTFVGPKNKMVFPEGGYNEFNGNFIKFTNQVPLTIQSARMYIGHGGKIKFTVADIVNYNPTNGSFSYFPISSNTLDVYPTTPNPQSGAVTGNNASDTGAVFLLNLPVPFAGNHAIIIECQDGASIFRNNNIPTNPYSFAIPGAFYITGNSAVNTANTSDTTYYRKYYYFFYDMQVLLTNCPSPRKAVIATNSTAPVITLDGKILTSSVANGNQWYVNDTAIAGATGQTDTVSVPGVYKTVVTDSIGCAISSNEIVYTPGSGIGLTVGPNPSNGNFTVQFYLAEASNVYINFVNAIGQKIYSASYPNYSGVFSKQLRIPSLSAGIYFLSIQIGNNKYARNIMIK
ncbi:MAG: S8 family serine peptidase [Bacteroidetes bacterium]|nr:S8 family serine peptidase [Bacteroidota bacterium]